MNRFVLRRLARGRLQPGDELVLEHRGAKLEASLLGNAAAGLGDGPVVVVPPGRLGRCRGRSCRRCATGW